MQKILSLIIFIILLAGTWALVHSTDSVSFETHSGIQTKLADLITQNLRTKKPNAKDLQIVKLWTEAMGDNKVRAVFAYKFIDGAGEVAAEQMVEGEAILHREPAEDPATDKWALQNVKTTNDSVNFTEGVLITPHETESSEVEEAGTAKPSELSKPAPSVAPTSH